MWWEGVCVVGGGVCCGRGVWVMGGGGVGAGESCEGRVMFTEKQVCGSLVTTQLS